MPQSETLPTQPAATNPAALSPKVTFFLEYLKSRFFRACECCLGDYIQPQRFLQARTRFDGQEVARTESSAAPQRPSFQRQQQRRHRLTLPSLRVDPAVTGQTREANLRTSMQLQCLLFSKLPPEIRQRIYDLIIGEQTFLLWRRRRLRGRREELCRRHYASRLSTPDNRVTGAADSNCPNNYSFCSSSSPGNPPPRCRYPGYSAYFSYPLSPLPFLQTCCRIYSEALPTLYTANIFDIRNSATVMDLQSSMPLHRFHTIRHLRVSRHLCHEPTCRYTIKQSPAEEELIVAWEDMWGVIAGMEGLLRLEVDISCCGSSLPKEFEQLILRSLRNITRPRRWELVVDWQEIGRNVEEAPFRLRRILFDDHPGRAF